MQDNKNIEKLVDHLFRREAGKMTAILIKLFGISMISQAEDIVQDTFLAAYKTWPYGDVPGKPEAWLMQVAKNKAIDILRGNAQQISLPHSAFITNKEQAFHQQIERAFSDHDTLDAQLKLLFLCCHPELGEKQQIALTLQVLCGFSINEIASALLMEKEAVKKTLLRTKQDIKLKGLFANTAYLYRSMQRLHMLRQVLYLMFNEGYKTTEDKELINRDLCFEAIRLGKIVLSLGDEAAKSETRAMLALMFFNVARFASRTEVDGSIISLEKQDRSKWDKALIKEAYFYLEGSRSTTLLSRYHIEAGIAALHCSAETYEQTNWKQIVYYYEQLEKIDRSPVVSLNKAIAIYHLSGAIEALKVLDRINILKLGRHYLFHATKASFLGKVGQYEEAVHHYKEAINLAKSQLDKQFLINKMEECRSFAN
ncbi:MAG TPA: sigma-70 family RNA polymerase sigma factor [Flavipsychrobacter sp.]|nr:sigma-70 family RNA polymerase sigma factor [Flavipsychrobacter sp.]